MSNDCLDNRLHDDHLHDEDAPLKVGLHGYRQFKRRMDKQLAELVARWVHTAAPNASRRIPRLAGHVNAEP